MILADRWNNVKLADTGKVVTGRTPRAANSEHYGQIHPFLTPSDMGFMQRDVITDRFLSDSGGLALDRIALPPGSPCFVCIGATIGKASLTTETTFTNQQINSIIVDQEVSDGRYLYYAIAHNPESLKRQAGGAATPILNKTAFSNIEIPLPPLPIQKRIADILSAYDDLIAVNTRRIEALEEMARRTYEEWFVHYRFPGGDGMQPEDWTEVKLGEIAAVNPEQIKPKCAPPVINYINIASVSKDSIDQVTEMDFKSAPSRARRVVLRGDTLWSCVRPNRMSHALVGHMPENTIASTGFAVIRPFNDLKAFIYCHLTTSSFVTYLVNSATGAAYPAVKASDFESAELMLPSKKITNSFEKIVAPMFDLKDHLQRQSSNLRDQRDLLLPRLISGEIDVSDAPLPISEAAE